MNFISKLIKKIFKKHEYVYLCIITSRIFSYQKEDYKRKILTIVQSDLKKHKKKIVDLDFYTDVETFESILIFSSVNVTSYILVPLIYEIYAYIKKNKDINVFSYKPIPIKTQILIDDQENNLTIYKFKIEC